MSAASSRRIRSVLIANRGEIALRIVRGVRTAGLRAIVAASEVDQDTPATRLANEVAFLGPAPPHESYLHIDRIIAAARRHAVDAIHPGYGFLAEDAAFAKRVEDEGFVFLGPTSEQIARLGDKLAARREVARAGIGPVPGSDRALRGREDLERIEAEIGLPLLLKASGGGGGRGIRIARSRAELAPLFALAASEARDAGADGRIFAERYIERGRHVEVQVLGDGRGGGRVFPERDCSIQRRLQKLVEETPAPVLETRVRDKLALAAFQLLRSTSYRGPGTLEFLIEPSGEPHFLEMNTRIQVEHPVTEAVTGIDLVLEQLRIAEGAELDAEDLDSARVEARGHAIEARVNAEEVLAEFRPASGRIERFELPGGPGIRVDSGIETGSEVHPFYDTLLAKVIAHGRDRAEALARLRVALDEAAISGVPTTLPFTRALLRNEEFRRGEYHCQTVSELLADSSFARARLDPSDPAILRLAAAAAFRVHFHRTRAAFLPTERRRSAWKAGPNAWPGAASWEIEGG